MEKQLFNTALNWLLVIEGGYVDHSSDKGGETRFGISKKSYPELNIKGLTKEKAAAIYWRDYWLKAHCDKLPPMLAWALFGAAVHHGGYKATVILQQALRVKADGINGAKTQAAAKQADQHQVLIDYCTRRARFMSDITIANHTQACFLNGWLKRLFALQQAILLQEQPHS